VAPPIGAVTGLGYGIQLNIAKSEVKVPGDINGEFEGRSADFSHCCAARRVRGHRWSRGWGYE
jgi:hypothetical protein